MTSKFDTAPSKATTDTGVSRRAFLRGSSATGLLLSSGLLAACTQHTKKTLPSAKTTNPFATMYGAMPNERFPLPAIDLKKIEKKFLRRQVSYRTNEPVGTLVVDTKNFFLYLVEENGMAMRYGVGLGRAGFEWSGRAYVARKASWPTWTPPAEMITRQPELEKWSWQNGGMPGGVKNPLGARALYIYQDGRDTLYRLHGTAEVWSIGKSVSSGCVRMLNQDIIDLHRRVPKQSPIVVL